MSDDNLTAMIATPTEIQYFLELFQVRHFTRAAIRLGVTQPTLTQSILRLEEKLKCKVFHRTRQGCVPTNEGDQFYKRARELIDAWTAVNAEVQSGNGATLQGLFRVGCHPSVGAYTIPKLIKNLYEQAPGIDIVLAHDSSRKTVEKIISFELDMGFVINPFKHPELVLKKIGSDRVTFWKKAQAATVPEKLFADLDLMQVEALLGRGSSKALKSWPLVQTNSLELIRTLTVSGAGVGILPERVAKADGARVELYDSKLPVFEDEIYVAYRRDTLKSASGKALTRAAQIALGVLN